jgi:hypothetical protein
MDMKMSIKINMRIKLIALLLKNLDFDQNKFCIASELRIFYMHMFDCFIASKLMALNQLVASSL